MIIRTVKNKENPYFMLNRAAVNDARLSYKAVGIHTYLMSKPDEWEANEIDIVKRHTEGRSAVRSAISELRKYGYMHRYQPKDKSNLFAKAHIDTYETPEMNPHFKGELTDEEAEIPESDFQNDEFPVSENRTADFPVSDFPLAGNLSNGKRTLVISELVKKERREPPPSPSSFTTNLEETGESELPTVKEKNTPPQEAAAPPQDDDYFGMKRPAKRKEELNAAENKKRLAPYGIDLKTFRCMVDAYLEGLSLKSLVDSNSALGKQELANAQDAVLSMIEMSAVKFPDEQAIAKLFKSWRAANAWMNKPVPSSAQIQKYASAIASGAASFDVAESQPVQTAAQTQPKIVDVHQFDPMAPRRGQFTGRIMN